MREIRKRAVSIIDRGEFTEVSLPYRYRYLSTAINNVKLRKPIKFVFVGGENRLDFEVNEINKKMNKIINEDAFLQELIDRCDASVLTIEVLNDSK